MFTRRRPYPQPEDRQRWVAGFEEGYAERIRAKLGDACTAEDEHFARWEGQRIAEQIWDIRHPSTD